MNMIEPYSPDALRALCRSGEFTGPTAGHAPGYVQANMLIVPREAAYDFLLFCQRNPRPCPLVEVLDAGSWRPRCAPGADIRSDLPGYRVHHLGQAPEEVHDITRYWRDDLVTFLIGCSFSFEEALIHAGIALRHIDQRRNVAMYATNIPCQDAGRFKGNMVVSMRPIKAADVSRAVEITARMPHVHGAPVHIGQPHVIGIADLARPDFGDAVELMDDEVPVFWACGVTPQQVARQSALPFYISHSPGKMLVTDARTD
jgi:uncharacterized protein YcsI (UPF0317 family)